MILKLHSFSSSLQRNKHDVIVQKYHQLHPKIVSILHKPFKTRG